MSISSLLRIKVRPILRLRIAGMQTQLCANLNFAFNATRNLFPAYELWFKQILFEVDAIRTRYITSERMDERCMLEIPQRTQRCVLILKVTNTEMNGNLQHELMRGYVMLLWTCFLCVMNEDVISSYLWIK